MALLKIGFDSRLRILGRKYLDAFLLAWLFNS